MPRGLTRTLSRAAARALGTQTSVSGLTRTVSGLHGSYQIVLSFNAMQIAVTDALAYASQKLMDLPDGRFYLKGGTASLQWAVLTTRASTINDSAGLTWSLGTAAASSATLATTMVDVIASTSKTLAAATTAYNTASTANAAAPAFFDGTGTAKDIYLNVAFATGTDIDGDGTLAVTGTITLNVEMLGDV